MIALYREVIVPRLRRLRPAAVALAVGTLVVAAAIALATRRANQPIRTRIAVVPALPSVVLIDREVPAEPTPTVEVLPFSADDLDPAMRYRGTLVKGARWRDAEGDNTVVFSELTHKHTRQDITYESSYLYAYHYLREAGGSVHLVRRVAQSSENCSDDLVSLFHAAHEVTDLDRDGTGEIMFGYFHGACVTDMSAAGFKLLLLEAGDKYILRGTGYFGGMDMPTSPTSVEVTGAPQAFSDHLHRRWTWLADQLKADLPL